MILKNLLKVSPDFPGSVAPGPITLWQIEGEKEETVTDFIFLGSKITMDADCSQEIKRHFLLWKESFDKDPDAGKD